MCGRFSPESQSLLGHVWSVFYAESLPFRSCVFYFLQSRSLLGHVFPFSPQSVPSRSYVFFSQSLLGHVLFSQQSRSLLGHVLSVSPTVGPF